jgi:hypothetical protein
MKKKVAVSLILLTIIGASVVFAQEPTLDKLTMIGTSSIRPANNSISGAVVIPDTFNGNTVTTVQGFAGITGITSVSFPNTLTQIADRAFRGCTGLTSITIPTNMGWMGISAFDGCTNLTSVTFQGPYRNSDSRAFQGDLIAKWRAGGAGTYTRPNGNSDTWTKQAGGFTLNGVWTRGDGMQITISEDGQTITITGNLPNNGGRLNRTYTQR